MRSLRTPALLGLAFVALLLGACTPAKGQKAQDVAAPTLAKIVPRDYTVLARSDAPLIPEAETQALIVTSAGPGLTPGSPVAGGTGDVQVLAFDANTQRWNVLFDAADSVPALGGGSPGGPVLDQEATLSEIQAAPVWFEGQPAPDLLIYAQDNSANHTMGVAAVVRFRTGSAEVLWRTTTQGMSPPKITGTAKNQTAAFEADYLTSASAACCPVRRFTQTLGSLGQHAVGVIADDRPYLGARVVESFTDPHTALVVEVVPGTPATGVLQPGDRLLNIAGSGPTPDPDDASAPPQVEQMAQQHAADTVTIRFQRGIKTQVRSLELASLTDADSDSTGSGFGVLGVDVDAEDMTIVEAPYQGPGGQAGLLGGDRLLSVGGTEVTTMDDLRVALWGTAVTPVEVTYLDTYGQRHTTTVTPAPVGEASTLPFAHRI